MPALAGSCFSDQSNVVQEDSSDDTASNKVCLGVPPPGELWACQDPSIYFPTVECLLADIKTCGIIGANGAQSVFYAFGVIKKGIGALRDQLTPMGNVYYDILDDNYWETVMSAPSVPQTDPKSSRFRWDVRERTDLLIARSAEAFALATSGDAILYVGQRKGNGDLLGAFQLPPATQTDPNIWRTYELPVLQRNTAVARIISIDVSNNNQQSIERENGQSPPGLDNPLLPEGSASAILVPPAPSLPPAAAPARFRRSKRDDDDTLLVQVSACPPSLIISSDTESSTASSSASTIIPPQAIPSCVLHDQDPDQGITQAYCLCDSIETLSPLSVGSTGHQSDSCAYTTLPATAHEAVTTLASTYTQNCQACTQVGFNAPSCTTVASCTPTSAQVTVQAGSSAVHVGTLTGTALYTSVSSALESLCPTVTQTQSFTVCETGSITIPNIEYVSADSLDTGGELVIKVASSSYNSTTLRNAMIKSAALTAQTGSEKPSSCSNQTYVTFVKRDKFNDLPLSRLFGGGKTLHVRDHPEPVTEHTLLCHTASFAGVGYFSPQWRQAKLPGAEAYIDATWEFQAAGGGDFFCDFIEDLEVGLAVIAPEFAFEDVASVPEVQAFCAGTLE
ncbi:uncharacterized protein Z519_09294 [Cladophialophora bantiana CBS 173.52]|uniref:Uncharacterized protein n=1 Tax=Cladophialophora bantiana (strain ATCC 10958 / CBS 173.52 / CDC B-1940 / NIH 8579) TaxID=1442370 RepID=A0A0D2HGD0_CLAB1|nr:uncharacterized protein Z519_09294 [Cladophialophora bantiana CBS 173.52]KIW89865.1 hypothetical protein Z519_09294 [Cladophialophora bantiana CBS 173.52]